MNNDIINKMELDDGKIPINITNNNGNIDVNVGILKATYSQLLFIQNDLKKMDKINKIIKTINNNINNIKTEGYINNKLYTYKRDVWTSEITLIYNSKLDKGIIKKREFDNVYSYIFDGAKFDNSFRMITFLEELKEILQHYRDNENNQLYEPDIHNTSKYQNVCISSDNNKYTSIFYNLNLDHHFNKVKSARK